MSDEFTAEELETVKATFRDSGCIVTDFSETHFEIVSEEFPAACLVYANPYFLEINTLLWARPQNFLGRLKSKRNSLLNDANMITNVGKLTSDMDSYSRDEGGWRIQMMARLVTGQSEPDFQASAVKNLITLILQDVANVVTLNSDFEIVAMIKDDEVDVED